MFGGSQVRTHGSVEDLIRTTLGARFIENTPPQSQEAPAAAQPSPAEEFGKMEIPSLNEISNPEVPVKENVKKRTPKICEGCSMVIDSCVCPTEEDDDFNADGDFTLDDPSENYIDFIDPEDLDSEDELTPFQKVLKSGIYKKKSDTIEDDRTSRGNRFQNTDGIGLKPRQEKPPVVPISKYYSFYRDRDEVFECKVTIEGTISTATVRLLLNTDSWNLVFYGKIKRDGTCIIPIKKLVVFPQGTTGRATLEVVVDDVVFSAWENAFRVEESKKVRVQIKGKS